MPKTNFLVNKYLYIIFGYAISVISTVSFIVTIVSTWTDQNYVQSLHLSPDADSIGIPLIGGVIMYFITGVFAFTFYLILFMIAHGNKRLKKLGPFVIFGKLKSKSVKVIRIIILLIVAIVIYSSFLAGLETINLISDISFYVATVSFLVSLIIFTSILVEIIDKKLAKPRVD